MSEDIDRALDAVAATARVHLEAVRAHGPEATVTMDAYDACAEAAVEYERLLGEQFDESAPWSPELELDDEEETDVGVVGDVSMTGGVPSDEQWIAVRVRADYFVEDEQALLAAADAAATAAGLTEWTPVRSVGDAFAVLLGSAAPVIAVLDVPGMQRGNGTATVHLTNYPLVDVDLAIDADEQGPFVMSRDELLAVVPDLVPDDLDDGADREGGDGRISGSPWRPDAPLTLTGDHQSVLGWAFGRDRY
ncbi:MAG: hypothetical protein QOH99_1463 [Frankiaceae bacterium]|nr:hypothetical protein [Frankiaceae bacterium]